MTNINWTNITVRLGDLKAWPDNPRQSTKAQAKKLLQSFDEFGQVETIAVSPELEVYNGHQRLSALMTIHGKDYQIDARQASRVLTEQERKKLTIFLHAGATGSWDWDTLSGWDASEMISWGLDDTTLKEWKHDISGLSEMLKSEKQEPVDAEPQIDKAEELRVKWGVESGQLWQIGDHRLLCGDCTKREDVELVMAGEKAELCLTDPPYATGGKSEDYDVFIGDLPKLIDCFLPLAKDVSNRILLTPGNAHQFLYPKPDWVLAWFVQAGVGANPWGFTFWNAIFAYGKDPYLARRLGSRPDAFVKTEASDKTEHSTSKPVGVWSWILERGSVDAGDIIFDPFIGSGTTMVACQNLNRKCRAIEISPAYCAVILERMSTAFPEIKIEQL